MIRPLDVRQQENLASLAAGILSFVAYAATASPTVSFIDAGELATAAAVLGIPHPTGYPLFAILGRLAAMIPVGGEIITRLNIASALLVSVSMAVFLKLVLFLQNSSTLFPAAKKTKSSPFLSLGAAIIGTLSLAFTTTVWAQSVAVEVYSLHILFLVLLSFTFLKGMEETMGSTTLSVHLLLFSFLLGLSFANHLTTLLLAPAFLYLYFVTLRSTRESWTLLLKLGPWFLLGLSAYLFLPLRSSGNPPLDWGHPAEPERFLWHVSGKQYRSWIFSSFESAERQLKYFFEHIPSEFHWVVLAFVVLGLWTLFWNRKKLFLFVGFLVVGCLAYSINYEIHDIDAYFLLAYVAAGIVLVFGVTRATTWVIQMSRGEARAGILWVPFLLLPALQWWENGTRVDESDNFLVHDYTENILTALDSNAVVLTYQWDYFVSASYYARLINKRRPDVVIIDKELLRRSWYFIQLERNHPSIIERSRGKVNAFLHELSKFEHSLPYNGQVIEARYNEMINDFIDKSFEDRPVYLGPEMEAQFAPGFERVPEGLMMRLAKPGKGGMLKEFSPVYRGTRLQSRLTAGLQIQYARAFTTRAWWKLERGDSTGVSGWLEKALAISPGYLPALRLSERWGGPISRNR